MCDLYGVAHTTGSTSSRSWAFPHRAAGSGTGFSVSDDVLERPAHGARLLVRLDPASGADARYTLAVSTAEGEWRGSATVRAEDGEIAFSAWGSGEPASWLVTALRALLRSAWQRRRTGEPWPRRLARWRPAPAAPEGA